MKKRTADEIKNWNIKKGGRIIEQEIEMSGLGQRAFDKASADQPRIIRTAMYC
jgi:hypothetical protein